MNKQLNSNVSKFRIILIRLSILMQVLAPALLLKLELAYALHGGGQFPFPSSQPATTHHPIFPRQLSPSPTPIPYSCSNPGPPNL